MGIPQHANPAVARLGLGPTELSATADRPVDVFSAQSRAAGSETAVARAQRDEVLPPIIQRIWHEHHQVYGPRKVWRQMGRENLRAARCRVRRLMRAMGLAGAVRGRVWITTTHTDPEADRPRDLVDRHFAATRPNQLRVSDFTYVATWRGFVYVAFVVDVFARRIVGWRVSSSLRTDFVLDALEQAIYDRCGNAPEGLIHHSDRGTQYLSMRYTDRLADAGIAQSVGSRGDSYDNALAEAGRGGLTHMNGSPMNPVRFIPACHTKYSAGLRLKGAETLILHLPLDQPRNRRARA